MSLIAISRAGVIAASVAVGFNVIVHEIPLVIVMAPALPGSQGCDECGGDGNHCEMP